MKKKISVIIPAHNEEKYVSRCIRSIKAASLNYGYPIEIIVVCNRCTDRTAEIAKKHGAKVVFNNDRCIAKVRNAGIFSASGDIIVTIDCDNRMTKGTLREIFFSAFPQRPALQAVIPYHRSVLRHILGGKIDVQGDRWIQRTQSHGGRCDR